MRLRLERGERIEQFATQRLKRMAPSSMWISPCSGHGREREAGRDLVISHDMTEQIKLRHEVDQTARLKADFLATMSHEIRTRSMRSSAPRNCKCFRR